MNDEGEELENMIPKIEASFNSIGLTLKKNENTFKSTFEIFTDLRDVWDDLSDMKRAEILELVAGKILPPYIVIYK